MTKMECDQNGMWPKWNVFSWNGTEMECDHNGMWPKWNLTKMEFDQNGIWPKWHLPKMEFAQNGQHWSYSNLYIHRFRLEKRAQVYSNLKQILSSTCPEKRMQFKVLLLFYPLHSVSKFHFWFKNSNWGKLLQNTY